MNKLENGPQRKSKNVGQCYPAVTSTLRGHGFRRTHQRTAEANKEMNEGDNDCHFEIWTRLHTPNAVLTDDEERATDARIGTLG